MKAFAIIQMTGGAPDIGELSYHGYVLCAQIGQNWGAYIFSGTAGELTAINALPQVYGICSLAGGRPHLAPELDNVIPPGVRTRLNTWLTARGYPTIPAGWTYRQVVLAIFRRMNGIFELEGNDIADS